jgi:hypothetical protein
MSPIRLHKPDFSPPISSIEICYSCEEEDEMVVRAVDGICTAHTGSGRTICPSVIIESAWSLALRH